MYQRQLNLKKVQRWWIQGDIYSVLNTLLALRDISVYKDFLDVNLQNTIFVNSSMD